MQSGGEGGGLLPIVDYTAMLRPKGVLYSPRNDPQPWNDPDPEMIPTFLLVDPEMILKELEMAGKHGTVDCSVIRESKAILA